MRSKSRFSSCKPNSYFFVLFETCANLGHRYCSSTALNEANSVCFHSDASLAGSSEVQQPLGGGAFSSSIRSGVGEGEGGGRG